MWRIVCALAPAVLVAWSCGSGADPCRNAPRYRVHVQPIVQEKCVGCHSSARAGDARNGAPAGVDFDSYEAVKSRQVELADAITSGRQPPVSEPAERRPTAEERDTVNAWRACRFQP